ncbi:hypothetical protein AGMMS50293_30520 [Spirochaetia bacterium]|nr:hypothetical protein AGMMS50293_30520 [Spirochaetia bacterium]
MKIICVVLLCVTILNVYSKDREDNELINIPGLVNIQNVMCNIPLNIFEIKNTVKKLNEQKNI